MSCLMGSPNEEKGMKVTRSLVCRSIVGLAFGAFTFFTLAPAEIQADVESLALAKYRTRVNGAVSRALVFLAGTQEADGSFTGKYGKTNGVVGLVGMAFMSKGYTPRTGAYSVTIRQCIDYVLATPSDNGYLGVRGGQMYGHAIATLFLSEVSGMVGPERQKQIDALLPKALSVILAAQNVKKGARHAGGWRYHPTSTESDMSVTGWNLMALRSARQNGAPVPVDAITRAIAYVDKCRDPRGGGYCYGPPVHCRKWGLVYRPSESLAGAGLLVRELTGHHADRANLLTGDYVLTNIRRRRQAGKGFFPEDGHIEYHTYYAAQGMFQLGGAYWDTFGKAMHEYLLPRQRSDGSWLHSPRGKAYPTAMYVLALTVTYRQLPIYQR